MVRVRKNDGSVTTFSTDGVVNVPGSTVWDSGPGTVIEAGDALLLEGGDFLLLESGTSDKLLLEPTA